MLIDFVCAGTSKERCTSEVQSCQVCNCFDLQLASSCLAGAQKGEGAEIRIGPILKIHHLPNDCSSCDNAVKRRLSTPYRLDRALPSLTINCTRHLTPTQDVIPHRPPVLSIISTDPLPHATNSLPPPSNHCRDPDCRRRSS
jgi:hypothetical protein